MQTETLPDRAASKEESQLVTFLLQDEEFGFDIMSVKEIIRVPRTTHVPRTPAFVDGIANLRGVVLPIIDMRTRFGMERSEETDRTRVLVVEIDGVKMGLRVDRVQQVTRVLRGDFDPPPAAIRGTSADYLDGVVKLDNGQRIIMALNAGQVCRLGASQRGQEAAALAAGMTKPAVVSEAIAQMVTFRIAQEEFAFPMEHVREILRVQHPKQVPDAPDYVLGVLTVRGQILPIVDLRRLLQQPAFDEAFAASCRAQREQYERPAGVQEDQRIIVVDANGFVLGVAVDHVNEVLKVPRRLLDPPPMVTSRGGLELEAVAKLDGGNRLVMVLDVKSLMRDRGLEQIRAETGSSQTAETVKAKSGAEPASERSELQLVTFLLGGEEYGVPISQIREIDRLSKITKVPKAAPFFEGVTNLRGEVIPVLDTRKRFDLEARVPDERTRIMIVELGGVKTGLIVDSVREVLRLSAKDIAPAPGAIHSGIDRQFISGIGKVDSGKRMVVLLDVAKILSRQDQSEPAESEG